VAYGLIACRRRQEDLFLALAEALATSVRQAWQLSTAADKLFRASWPSVAKRRISAVRACTPDCTTTADVVTAVSNADVTLWKVSCAVTKGWNNSSGIGPWPALIH